MSQPFNKLSESELERLALLFEEMAEAQQIVGKIIRHGYESGNPLLPYIDNRTLLEKEIGHVVHAIERMIEAKDVSENRINDASKKKAETIQQWLHHQHPVNGGGK